MGIMWVRVSFILTYRGFDLFTLFFRELDLFTAVSYIGALGLFYGVSFFMVRVFRFCLGRFFRSMDIVMKFILWVRFDWSFGRRG